MGLALLKNNHVKQSLLLLSATGFNIVAGIGINFFLARILGKERLGDYSFILNIFTFSQVIFNFGFFQSIGRMIALADNKNESRRLYGAGLLIVCCLYVLMSLSLISYALLSSNVAQKGLVNTLLITIPFGWISLLTNFNELLLQGDNRIGLLSQSRMLPRAIYISILAFVALRHLPVNLNLIIILYFTSYIASYLYIIHTVRPAFGKLRTKLREIIASNRKFGFHIYVGALIAVGSNNLSGIIVSYYETTNVAVGYFAIASQLCMPLALLPNIIASVLFKKFTSYKAIPWKVIVSMLSMTILALFVLLLMAEPLVLFIYGPDFYDVVGLVKLLSVGFLMYGIGDFFNRFLLAHGKGKELRNSSFVVGVVLLVLNFVLISRWSITGAAWAKIATGLVYSLIILYFYLRLSLSLKQYKSR